MNPFNIWWVNLFVDSFLIGWVIDNSIRKQSRLFGLLVIFPTISVLITGFSLGRGHDILSQNLNKEIYEVQTTFSINNKTYFVLIGANDRVILSSTTKDVSEPVLKSKYVVPSDNGFMKYNER